VASAELDATVPGPRQASMRTRLRGERKFGLRVVLAGLVLLTVTLTAILIHVTWFYTARQNFANVVGQLNRQIVGSVQHEVRGTLIDSWKKI
jgi:hypothetical protein